MSIADEIFTEQKAIGLKRELITAWGKPLWAWELSVADRDAYEASRLDTSKPKKPKINFQGSKARLVVMCLRESDKEDAPLVFQASDAARLQRLGGKELDKVFTACAVICGIQVGDDEEESPAAKNSNAPSAVSSSA